VWGCTIQFEVDELVVVEVRVDGLGLVNDCHVLNLACQRMGGSLQLDLILA